LREVEAPTFSDIRLIDGGMVVSHTRRPLFFYPQEDSWYSFLLEPLLVMILVLVPVPDYVMKGRMYAQGFGATPTSLCSDTECCVWVNVVLAWQLLL
jgi:hypothetical protein